MGQLMLTVLAIAPTVLEGRNFLYQYTSNEICHQHTQ